jgi:hypothetical protein
MDLEFTCTLYRDRTKLGLMSVSPVPYDATKALVDLPCLAIADRGAAAQHGNPTSDPLLQYGNTPIGVYSLTLIPASDPSNFHAYGPNKRWLLTPISGDGVKAEGAPGMRAGLLIHGGDLNSAYVQWKGLRPTYGCIRMSDGDIAKTVQLYESLNPGRVTLRCYELDGQVVS